MKHLRRTLSSLFLASVMISHFSGLSGAASGQSFTSDTEIGLEVKNFDGYKTNLDEKNSSPLIAVLNEIDDEIESLLDRLVPQLDVHQINEHLIALIASLLEVCSDFKRELGKDALYMLLEDLFDAKREAFNQLQSLITPVQNASDDDDEAVERLKEKFSTFCKQVFSLTTQRVEKLLEYRFGATNCCVGLLKSRRDATLYRRTRDSALWVRKRRKFIRRSLASLIIVGTIAVIWFGFMEQLSASLQFQGSIIRALETPLNCSASSNSSFITARYNHTASIADVADVALRSIESSGTRAYAAFGFTSLIAFLQLVSEMCCGEPCIETIRPSLEDITAMKNRLERFRADFLKEIERPAQAPTADA